MKDYINSQHRYYTADFYYKKTYKSKVARISLNGNFTCPNRDGTISNKGCIFCSDKGSGDFGGDKNDSLKTQFSKIKDIISIKWPKAKYIVYFQANTNTYAPLNKLKALYEEAISLDPNIIGINIATRADCISDELIIYLQELNEKCHVTIELGLQSANDNTAKLINRGYLLNCFTDTVKRLRKANIETIVHIINGLPYETKKDMLDTINYINSIDIQGIKIHSLYILKNSIISKMYEDNLFTLLSKDEYIDIITEQIALLKDDIVIYRIGGDAPINDLIAPTWGIKKLSLMNDIDKEMKRKNYFQGCKYKKSL